MKKLYGMMREKGVLKYLILLSTFYATAMMLHWPEGFTYFTQLSNLYAALITGIQLTDRRNRERLTLWKYTAAVSITLTFLIFLFALAPMDPRGLVAAYTQDHCASLCLHMITPVLTGLDFLRNDAPVLRWKGRYIPLAVLPPVLYFIFILVLGQCGFRWRGMTAPYPFLNYAAPAGWFGFLPETADDTTLGIGVFYFVAALIGAVLLTGWVLLTLAKSRSGRCPAVLENTSGEI